MARETTSQAKGTAQSGRARSDAQAARGGQNGGKERERSISTAREGAQQGQVRGQGLSRRPDIPRHLGSAWSSGDPFTMMQRMADDMEQLMDELGLGRLGTRPRMQGVLPAAGPRLGAMPSTTWSPQIEVRQRGDRILVRADLPGLKREDVQIDVDNDMLTIRGERREEREQEEGGVFRSERTYGHFARTIPLPDGVDPEACEATYKDGVLEVHIPIPAQSRGRSRRIEVK